MVATAEPRRWVALRIAAVAVICAVAAVRVAGAALRFIPRWLALIFLVFAALELASVAWNLARRRTWNERTFIDLVSDAVVFLPWP